VLPQTYSQWPLRALESVNVPELLATPPGVVIAILPATAPLGTVAVTFVSEFTMKLAFTPPNATLVVCFRLTPVMVTKVPTDPLVGEKLVICGITRNNLLLLSAPWEVVTVTKPVVAPLGTAAVRKVLVFTEGVAGVPLKEIVVAAVKPCPRNCTDLPTLPEYGSRLTDCCRLAFNR
jgi:hypothetical protein